MLAKTSANNLCPLQHSVYNLKGHKVICIMVSIDIYTMNIISLIKHLYSNKIIFIDYVKSKENIVNSSTKGLLREFVYNSLRGMGLKPLKIKECNNGNHI